jgi:hypothetical protein
MEKNTRADARVFSTLKLIEPSASVSGTARLSSPKSAGPTLHFY